MQPPWRWRPDDGPAAHRILVDDAASAAATLLLLLLLLVEGVELVYLVKGSREPGGGLVLVVRRRVRVVRVVVWPSRVGVGVE